MFIVRQDKEKVLRIIDGGSTIQADKKTLWSTIVLCPTS